MANRSFGSGEGNNRSVQPTNGRKVYKSNNKMFENPMGASTLMAGASATILAAMLF